MHRSAALIVASAVAITPAQAQTTYELSISGTVEKLGGNLVALSLSQGISVVVRLDSEPRVNSVAKGSGSDLKAGSQVSIQARSGQSGDLIATQIVLFAPGSNRPDAEPGPDNAQLVATIKKTDASPEGPVLIIPDKDKDRKITIGPDTAIRIVRAARIADIKVGSAVTMTAVKRPPSVRPGRPSTALASGRFQEGCSAFAGCFSVDCRVCSFGVVDVDPWVHGFRSFF